MEFDPLSRDVAPPRHEVESDSEDDEREAGPSSRQHKSFVPPRVRVSLDRSGEVTQLVVLQGEGGEAFVQASLLSECNEIGQVTLEGEQIGSFASIEDANTMIALLRPSIRLLSDQANAAYICSSILSSIKPQRLLVIDDYNPHLYLSEKTVTDPPIRHITTTQSKQEYAYLAFVAPFQAPNYVLGLGASMLNESSIQAIPTTLFLLPQVTNSHLQSWSRVHTSPSPLDAPPDAMDEELATRLAFLLHTTRITSASAGSGKNISVFLQERRSQARRQLAQNISAMYV